MRLTLPETRSEDRPGRSEGPCDGVPGTEDAGVKSGLRGVRASPGPKIESSSAFTSVGVEDLTGVWRIGGKIMRCVVAHGDDLRRVGVRYHVFVYSIEPGVALEVWHAWPRFHP